MTKVVIGELKVNEMTSGPGLTLYSSYPVSKRFSTPRAFNELLSQ